VEDQSGPGSAGRAGLISLVREEVADVRTAGRSGLWRAGSAAVALVLAVTLSGCVVRHGALLHLRPGECKGGDPLAGVYIPSRLHVEKKCLTVMGTAECVRREPDGDIHILVRLARRYRWILTPANAAQHCPGARGGGRLLVVEIIPQQGSVLLPDNSADRAGFVTPAAPRTGDRISVTGPYVLDTNELHDLIFPGVKNWAEIHPAWNITIQRHH
jgi:hypothetical protein